MSEKSLFPRRSEIFKENIKDVRDSVARPSLDTLYQVTFSFGNYNKWLGTDGVNNMPRYETIPAKKRSQGRDFMRKMSLLCTEAEIPGTQYQSTLAVGHHQGIQEEFPNLRTFPPLNLTFYVDADHVVLEIFESWMTFINPITNAKRNVNAYGRFNYPEDYKEILHITKFERDTFLNELPAKTIPPQLPRESTTRLTSYEFVNVWPTNMTSMRVAYGDTNVLRCSVQFAYDRFFTTFNYADTNQAVESTYFNLLSSKEQAAANSLKDSYDVGNTWPLSPEGQKQLEAFNKSKDYVSPFERKHGKKQK